MPENVRPGIRYLFYLFALAVPFEGAITETASLIGSIPMILGVVLTGAALLQPRVCFTLPPGAFWCFVGYWILCLVLVTTQNPDYMGIALSRNILKFAQMLLLMWISVNLFRHPEIRRNALLVFVAACAILAALQVSGIGAASGAQGRTSMFGENANTVGGILSLGLIMLVGIAYGRGATVERSLIRLAWIAFPIIGTAIVMTGSRGALVGLLVGIALLFVREGTWKDRLKIGSIGLLAIGFLVFTALSNDAMRTRLEHAWYQGDTAGRDIIHAHAWAMVSEKPMLGWGPLYNEIELGSRVGRSIRGPHSLYLAVLTESGLLGSIIFFGGLVLLVRAAWQARLQAEGALPMALMGSFLVTFLAAPWTGRKVFWLVIAYVLASAWPFRGTAREAPVRLAGSTNVMGQKLGTATSFSQAAKRVSGAGPSE